METPARRCHQAVMSSRGPSTSQTTEEGNRAGNTESWTPSWKAVIITVLLGANIVFIRIIEALVYSREQCNAERSTMQKDLCTNSSNMSGGCHLCPPDWLLHGDQCYYFSDVTERTWEPSRDQCKMMGSDLLVIKDKEQQEFIERTLSQRADDTYWIGLHHDGDGWRWVDGEQYTSSLIQIKTSSPGSCISVTRSSYYTTKCYSNNRWICAREAVRI
ncbi:killer cell lectin-like receptor subfamily B member 1C isoform X2 [Dendropsophus ebraccatus]|uniref:killer cell lectin-like receptor subfamily B member 1C isoform X2 n=1 Tax=Dendropsophus ebraccatus TaxID=150705 RepID=UPI003831A2FA